MCVDEEACVDKPGAACMCPPVLPETLLCDLVWFVVSRSDSIWLGCRSFVCQSTGHSPKPGTRLCCVEKLCGAA